VTAAAPPPEQEEADREGDEEHREEGGEASTVWMVPGTAASTAPCTGAGGGRRHSGRGEVDDAE